jgi:hypothetical protein
LILSLYCVSLELKRIYFLWMDFIRRCIKHPHITPNKNNSNNHCSECKRIYKTRIFPWLFFNRFIKWTSLPNVIEFSRAFKWSWRKWFEYALRYLWHNLHKTTLVPLSSGDCTLSHECYQWICYKACKYSTECQSSK